MGVETYRQAMIGFAQHDQQQFATGQVEYVAAVSDDPDTEAVMSGAEPFAYYGTARSASPGWVNQVTRLSIRELLTFDAAMAGEFLGATPTLIVHGRRDAFCSPADAQALYDGLTGPRELRRLDTTNHIDLYDQPAFVDPAVEHVAR